MVSDDELQRHVNQMETARSRRRPTVPTIGRTESTLEERVDELQHAARETHDELARRITRVDDASADDVRVDRIVDRLDDIEERLSSLEAELSN